MKKVLLSFVGTNDAGKLIGANDGAILTALSNDKFDAVYLLWNKSTSNKISFKEIVSYLSQEISNRNLVDNINTYRFSFLDITDHNEIYQKLKEFTAQLPKSEYFNYTASISSGTQSMQGNWWSESGTRGRKNNKKRLSVFAIEKNGKGISRMYGKEISKSSSSEFRRFFNDHISPEAIIRTDKWTGYKPLKQEYKNLIQEESGQKGKNFPEMHRAIMMFKSWLRGIHHSVTCTQAYIDEYTYRFNRQFMTKGLFENLLKRMVNHEPMDYKKFLVT